MQVLLPPRYLSSSKMKNKDSWTTNAIDRTVCIEQTKRALSCKAWKRGPFSPVPLMVQDFDRRSNPTCPFNHEQANLTKHEQRRQLHEKCFPPGVNNLSQSFLFAFDHSVSFSRFTVALLKSKQIWPRAQKKLKTSRCTETCICPTVGAGWLHQSSSFRNFANFDLERSFLYQNKAWRLGFSKHPPKQMFSRLARPLQHQRTLINWGDANSQ